MKNQIGKLIFFFILATWSNILFSQVKYSFNNFDNFNYSDDLASNQFFGNWGPLVSEYISIEFDKTVRYGDSGNSLNFSFHDLSGDSSFTGLWQSLWRFSDSLNMTLDLAEFDSIEFFVRGSGRYPGRKYQVKLEFTDNRPQPLVYDFPAFRYIAIDDDSTNWQRIVFSADVSNALAGWKYFKGKPDIHNMKLFNIVLEARTNQVTAGSFYIDEINFIRSTEIPFPSKNASDKDFLEYINRRSFDFFKKLARADNGLIPDRASFSDLYSVAGCGFGLSAYAIAAHNGWMDYQAAYNKAVQLLRTLDITQKQQRVNPKKYGIEGFFYHFLNADGTRKDSTELSTIDTGLLLFGAISAGEYFQGEAKELSDSLFARVNWEWFLQNEKKQFYLGWKPEFHKQTIIEGGFEIYEPVHGGYFSGMLNSPATWDYYTDEVILISILAIASPKNNISKDVFYTWKREYGNYGGYSFIQSWPGSLFTYFFAHCWLPLEKLDKEKTYSDSSVISGINWFENSKKAALANRQYCIDHSNEHATYHQYSWGLTACETGRWEPPLDRYKAWGAQPSGDQNGPASNGTIAPYGAACSILFMPETVIQTLRWYFENTKLWHPFLGFMDAYNLSKGVVDFNGGPWYNYDYFGIDVGPALIMIDNHLSNGFLHSQVLKNKLIGQALDKYTGLFTDVDIDESQSKIPNEYYLHQNYPNPFNPKTKIRYAIATIGHVRIVIYNMNGQKIRILVNGQQSAGRYSVSWDGRSADGDPVTSGVYLVRMEAGRFVAVRKVVLAR